MQPLAKEGGWPMAYHVRAAPEAKPGAVLAPDLGGGVSGAVFFSDIPAIGAQMAGVRGAALYGASRDLAELRAPEGIFGGMEKEARATSLIVDYLSEKEPAIDEKQNLIQLDRDDDWHCAGGGMAHPADGIQPGAGRAAERGGEGAARPG
jgi:hypothetical protein